MNPDPSPPPMPYDASDDGTEMPRRLAARLGARLVETHISWVLLGEREAFKLKKPLRMPFLDYSTPEARRHCCEEEVRINARLAPGLYLGVVSVHGTPQDPRIGGDGPVLDWAVRMRRFDDGALFGERLAQQRLAPAEVDAMADLLAAFHEAASVADATQGLGTGDRRRAAALAALEGASAALQPVDQNALQAWLLRESHRLAPCWAARLAARRIRECHGDLHLDNLLWIDGAPAAFDGIEFNPALRWIDVADDIAFPVMDLAARGRPDFAWRLLNRWLDHTGDHGALGVLRFAAAYRALVRAQVALLRADAP
ncbi:MAG: phosphotransferase, partial [Pseudomonadota bacterium]